MGDVMRYFEKTDEPEGRDSRFTIWMISEAKVHSMVVEVLRCVDVSLGRVWRNRSIVCRVMWCMDVKPKLRRLTVCR
ncbi:hypothetical protein PIB30_095815 [Stylosanthes scabra]|uniref:Uncharacterized protein n=1 Tax=Stylosanthes scabra TaxID=79078 RepID=A0ABU6QV65_9FABA|nr:hypothetical protein [Stylosanthes scabra]